MREFLWSEDMASACVFLIENRDFKTIITNRGETQNSNEIINTHINIGTGKDISIRSLAETIQKEIAFKGGIKFDSSKPDGNLS